MAGNTEDGKTSQCVTLLYPLWEGEVLCRAGLLRRLKSPPSIGRNITQVNVTCCGDKRLDACCREARKHDGLSFTKGGKSVIERAEGILPVCSCVQCEFRFFDLSSSHRPNVSCDDTVLPARSSNWTPVTSPTRNPFAVTRCIDCSSDLFG